MLSFETIDTSTEEGKYLVAAVGILFRRRNSRDLHFNQTMDKIREELERMNLEHPEGFFGRATVAKKKCVRCGAETGSDAPLQLCGDCAYKEYSSIDSEAV